MFVCYQYIIAQHYYIYKIHAVTFVIMKNAWFYLPFKFNILGQSHLNKEILISKHVKYQNNQSNTLIIIFLIDKLKCYFCQQIVSKQCKL